MGFTTASTFKNKKKMEKGRVKVGRPAKQEVEQEVNENEVEFTAGESLSIDEAENGSAFGSVDLSSFKREEPMVERRVNVKSHSSSKDDRPLINCLRNERVIVRYIMKEDGVITNKDHVLYGGWAENAKRTFSTPIVRSSGCYVNVLTDDEKRFLENIMGLEENALSIYRKNDNFWNDSNSNGVSQVTLYKRDNYFDLSVPEDYIRYKILLANKDFIAPSMKHYNEYPKATYQFVVISEGEDSVVGIEKLNDTMKSYLEFGKIENNADLLSVIIEIIDGKPVAKNTKIEWMKTKIDNIIRKNSKLFLKVVTDPMLRTKALIKKAVEFGVINVRGNFYYTKVDNNMIPLCSDGEDPTFEIAARFLNLPKNQELKLMIEAKTR